MHTTAQNAPSAWQTRPAASGLVVAILLGMGIGAVVPRSAAQDSGTTAPKSLVSHVRQLTFEGRRAGEGYFSRDGSLMVFQSEREPGNPFYQIYLMDMETGDTERISPGVGKTTCAWIAPDNRHVLFASTQDDPQARAKQKAELADRAAGKQRRYAWDYDDQFELYVYDRQTKQYQRLTHARGYDAEGDYSPDGKKIVFASNRLAYSQPLAPEDAKKFEHDKSFMMDLYMMDADGSNVRRLTTARGYDGGPFFSFDGSKICWRRFSEDGATAEIYTMDADGTHERQLTHLGAMSWAPFFHPSGKYLIFTTNLQGFANFELYIVSADGGPVVRATYRDGFDGLPVFTPDGKHLAWTSSLTENKQGQIFYGDWDHERALRLLAKAGQERDAGAMVENPTRPVAATSGAAPKTEPAIRAEDLRQYVTTLASDAFDGRLTGTKGERLATQYVADQFKRFGLEPGGEDGSFFQPFEFTAGMEVEPSSALTIQADPPIATPKLNEDWRPLTWSHTGTVEPAGIVWGGYGIVASGEGVGQAYDSFGQTDVKGKWVMVLRFMPEGISPERRQELARFTSLRYKAMTLRDKRAAGMIVVSGPTSGVKSQLVPIHFDASASQGSLPVISITDALADKLLKAGGAAADLETLQKALDGGEPQPCFALKSVRLGATIALKRERKTGRNVLAWLRGDGTSGQPALVIGAHVDHLGHGTSNSLAREDEKGQIHHGADDNASGTAGLMEIAEYLADLHQRGKLPLKRDVLFAAWSGEELGLLGSKHFVEAAAEKSGSKNDLHGLFAAYLNMDMIGRYRDKLILNGIGSSTIWRREVERRNAPVGLNIQLAEDSYLPTDATSFFLKGVPILAAFTGTHEDYHSPRDTADKINYEGEQRIARFMALVARSLAMSPVVPDYQKPSKPKPESARAHLRAYLGTIPSYGDEGVKGLKLSGVSKDGPAEKAGLKAGDVVVELAGRKVENIYDYTYALEALKAGQPTTIVVMRDGERMKFDITPGSRD